MNEPSLTIENYLKTIYQICARDVGSSAATGKLASALNVSPGTVTSMLKTLNEGGLANYTPYEGVQLTDSGRSVALRVIRRHRLIELFLVRTLRLSWDEVHEEAENMEHAVSDFLVNRIDEYLGFPETDPHGDPIPKEDGSVAAIQTTCLADWQVGSSFRLVRVLDQSPQFLRYLSESGMSLDIVGEVVSRTVEAGIVKVTIGEDAITLAQAAAAKLVVTSP